jgi:hypothetical protein
VARAGTAPGVESTRFEHEVEEMSRFNAELGKAVKILSLNGLHPLNTGAQVAFDKGKPTRACRAGSAAVLGR